MVSRVLLVVIRAILFSTSSSDVEVIVDIKVSVTNREGLQLLLLALQVHLFCRFRRGNLLKLLIRPVGTDFVRLLLLSLEESLLHVVAGFAVLDVFEQRIFVVQRTRRHNAALLGSILPVFELSRVQSIVLLLQLAHLFDFI